jgi:hypothetical protein
MIVRRVLIGLATVGLIAVGTSGTVFAAPVGSAGVLTACAGQIPLVIGNGGTVTQCRSVPGAPGQPGTGGHGSTSGQPGKPGKGG